MKDVWFARNKKKTVKRCCRCKNLDANETNAHYRRILVTSDRTDAGVRVTYLTFIFLTL
jgi:hypothetical protein